MLVGVLRGCLKGPRGTIGGLMNTLKTLWLLLYFEHVVRLGGTLEVLGRLCGTSWGPWSILGKSLGGPRGTLGVLGRSLVDPSGPYWRQK